MIQLGQYAAPRHVVAHLSDPHLIGGGGLHYGVIDNDANLRRTLDRLAAVQPAPRAIVFTGDLADRAEPDAYDRLRSIVEPFAAGIGATLVWTMGNHDERAPFAKALFDSDDAGCQDRVHEVDGLRIVALDTSVPGYHHGELLPEQLAWLADVLATPAEHGTLLAMHHPPLPLPMIRAAELIELHDQQALADVITGTDVRGILAGHLHLPTWSTFAGIPVSVASATCYSADPAPVERFVSGVDGHQAFTMAHVYDDRVVNTVVPVADVPEVSGYPSDVRAQVEALSHEERHDMFARKDSDFNTAWEDHSPRT